MSNDVDNNQQNQQNEMNNSAQNQESTKTHSPKTLQAIKHLGYTLNDFKKVTREEIIEQEREKLFRVPKGRVQDYIDLRFQHYQQNLQQKLDQVQEMKSRLGEEKSEYFEGSQAKHQTQSLTSSQISKEEYKKRQQEKLEKLEEQQKKQIDFMLKNQLEADELRKREEFKKEKMRQLEEKKLLEQKMRQLESEQQRFQWEQKAQELEKEKQAEQERMIKRFEEKELRLKQKLEEKEKLNTSKREKNQEEREMIEQKIQKNTEEQMQALSDLQIQYDKRIEMNEAKLKELIEKRDKDQMVRREISENKRKNIQDKFQHHEKMREELNKMRVKIKEEKEEKFKINEIQQHEMRKDKSEQKNMKIQKVREQFRKLVSELQQKKQEEEEILRKNLMKANRVREEKLEDTSLMQYQHQLQIEDIIVKSRRIQVEDQKIREQLMNKINNDTSKLIKEQQDKKQLYKIKEQILNQHDIKKQQIISEIALIQKGSKDIYKSQYLIKSQQFSHQQESQLQESQFSQQKKRDSSLPESNQSSLTKKVENSKPAQITTHAGSFHIASPNSKNSIQLSKINNNTNNSNNNSTKVINNNNNSSNNNYGNKHIENEKNFYNLGEESKSQQLPKQSSQTSQSFHKQNKLQSISYQLNQNPPPPKPYETRIINQKNTSNPNLLSKPNQFSQKPKVENKDPAVQPSSPAKPLILTNGIHTRKPAIRKLSIKNDNQEASQPQKIGNATSRSTSSAMNPQQEGMNYELFSSQKIRKQNMQLSAVQAQRKTHQRFEFHGKQKNELIKSKGESYKSNKFIQEEIAEQYVEDLRVVQKLAIQDVQIILSKQVLVKFQGDLQDQSKLERISKELLETYARQEAHRHKFHYVYQWFNQFDMKE